MGFSEQDGDFAAASEGGVCGRRATQAKPRLPKSAVSSHGVVPPGGRGGFARE